MAILEDVLKSNQVFQEGRAFEGIERQEMTWFPQTPEDLTVLKIVVQDVQKAEAWLQNNKMLDQWADDDRLYLFQVPVDYWEGTNPPMPRAHLGMPLVFEHVESLLPQIMIGVFQENPPFQSKPRPGTKMQAARANDAILEWELSETHFQREVRLVVKSALQHGLGVAKLGWENCKKTRREYVLKGSDQIITMGADSTARLPGAEDEFEEKVVEEVISHPTFDYVPLRHLMVAPDWSSSDIRQAKWVAHRMYLTVEQLDALRDYKGYKNIPERAKLGLLFIDPKEVARVSSLEGSSVDMSKEFAAPEARSMGTTIDPLRQPLEVIEYTTPDRTYVVLQRKVVIRNEGNEFGEINYRSLPCFDVLDQGYGIGIARLIGNEQRVQQGTINTFLDELSLTLNGMFARRIGANIPTSQLRMRPGGIIDVHGQPNEDVNKSLALVQRQTLPIMEIQAVIAASDARAQRRTAASELAVQGSLPSEKSSITRTATGANLLAGGSGARIQGNIIENLGIQVIVPTLEAFHNLNARRLKPSQYKRILSEELGQAYEGNISDLVNAKVSFELLAASKLQSRRQQAAALPTLLPFLMAEPVIQAVQMAGKKINMEEIINMVYDVSGWPNKQDVIVPMTPDDEARMAMNNPGVQQMLADKAKTGMQHEASLNQDEENNIARTFRDMMKESMRAKTQEKKDGQSKSKA